MRGRSVRWVMEDCALIVVVLILSDTSLKEKLLGR